MSTSERKKRERLERKNSILDAAEKLMIEQDFDTVRMDEIAAASEVSKGTLYLYFNNKTEIVLALLNRGVRDIHEDLAREITSPGTGLDIIQRMNRVFFTFAERQPQFFKSMMYTESIGLKAIKDLKDTETVKEIEAMKASLFNFVQRAVQIGIQDGSIDGSFKPDFVTIQILSATRGLMQQIIYREQGMFMGPGPEMESITLEQLLNDYMNMLVRALRPQH
ncbi:MAG: TetR/AcrR family transcriptional regulator [Balneolia bacterium]|nr:TetR/AcrR family transcriptional regulator [Balneolia bacterium]